MAKSASKTINEEAPSRKQTILFLSINKIKCNPKDNGRFAPPPQDKLEELKASIAEHGQRQPGEVVKDGEMYRLVSGFGRFRAVKLLNSGRSEENEIPFQAKLIEANEQKGFELNLEENIRRNDLSPMDLSYGCCRLKEEFGYDLDQLSDFFRVGAATIQNWLSLQRLNEGQQKKVHTGEIGESVAYGLAGAPTEKRAKILEEAEAESLKEGKKRASVKSIRKAVRKHTQRSVSITFGDFKDFLSGTEEDSTFRPFACVQLDYIEGRENAADTFTKLEKLISGKSVSFSDRHEKDEDEPKKKAPKAKKPAPKKAKGKKATKKAKAQK